jgi:hypothetical protein
MLKEEKEDKTRYDKIHVQMQRDEGEINKLDVREHTQAPRNKTDKKFEM